MSLQEYIKDAATSLGITTLKTEQQEAIRQFVLGRDVFVSLPTGYGKSACYFSLPFVFDRLRRVEKKSIVVVVSPLVALMKDQVAQCSSRGLAAGFVSTDPNDHSMRRQVMEAKFQIVFMTPEALFAGRKWRELLKEEPYHSNLVGFVIDEAHCVKKW